MEIESIAVETIAIGTRHRAVDDKKLGALKSSMDDIGLQTPITVWLEQNGEDNLAHLVVGRHRLEAARLLRWESIDAFVTDADELDRELWEIDENLMRAELGPAEMAEHTAKRAELVKQKAAIVNGQLVQKPAHRPSEGQEEFEEETAKATGKSTKTVRRDKARGEAIPADVLGKIRGAAGVKWGYHGSPVPIRDYCRMRQRHFKPSPIRRAGFNAMSPTPQGGRTPVCDGLPNNSVLN